MSTACCAIASDVFGAPWVDTISKAERTDRRPPTVAYGRDIRGQFDQLTDRVRRLSKQRKERHRGAERIGNGDQ